MGPSLTGEPPPAPGSPARDQTSPTEVAVATIIAVVIAVVTDLVSSIHPLIPIAITPALTALVTVGARGLLTRGDAPRRRRPSTALRTGRIVLLTAALAFVLAIGVVTALDVVRGRALDEGTVVGTRVEVPDVEGRRRSAALRELRDAGLEPAVEPRFSGSTPRFRVIETDPGARTSVRNGSTVTVVVSAGPAPVPRVSVPDVVGDPVEGAIADLDAAGLGYALNYGADGGAPQTVVHTTPATGKHVEKGSAVTLYVAGTEPTGAVVLPNAVGAARMQAEETLTELGLKVGIAYDTDSVLELGTVVATDPGAGTEVEQGASVTLRVAALEVPDVRGRTEKAARAELEGQGFTVSVTMAASPTAPEGNVIATNPAAGQASLERSIVVTVSSGPPVLTAPSSAAR